MFDPYSLYTQNIRSSVNGQIIRKRPSKTYNLNDFQKMIKILTKNGYYVYQNPYPEIVNKPDIFMFPVSYLTSYNLNSSLNPNFSIKLYEVLDFNTNFQYFIEQHKHDNIENFTIDVIINSLIVDSTYVTGNSNLSVSSRFISDIYDKSQSLSFPHVEQTHNNYCLITNGNMMHCDFGIEYQMNSNHFYSRVYTDVPKHDDTKPNYALSTYYDNQKELWEGLCIDGSTPLPWANDILITMEYAIDSETTNVSTIHNIFLAGVINISLI